MKPTKYLPSLITLLQAALVSVSCTSEFDIDTVEAGPKAVVYCMPAAGCDTTVIQLSKTVPVTQTETPPAGIPGAEILFTVNGEPQPVMWAERKTGMVPRQCYYVVKSLKEGDRIDIAAQVGDLPTVSSSTTVPAPFPFDMVEVGTGSTETGPMRQFKVTFTDDATTEDYYGVRVLKKSIFRTGNYNKWQDEWTHYSTESVVIEQVDCSGEPLLNNKVGLDATFDFDFNYYQDLYIWNDDGVAGRSYTLRLNVPLTTDSIVDEDDYYMYDLTEYKICLYRLSAEMYRFVKAFNDVNNNELGQNGLAPIRSHYSNIRDGFGIAGACNILETEWLANGVSVPRQASAEE